MFSKMGEPAARDLYPDWEQIAAVMIANLRLVAGRHPEDPQLNELIGRLCIKAPELHARWTSHEVDQCAHGTQHFHHPVAGELRLHHETLTFPVDPDQVMCLYTAKPGSEAAQALKLLASWTTTDSTTV